MTYVLIRVGCLECGEPTEVLGVYDRAVDAGDAIFEAATSFDGGVRKTREIVWKESFSEYEGVGSTCVAYEPGGSFSLQLHLIDAVLPKEPK